MGGGGGEQGHVKEDSAEPPKKRCRRAGWFVRVFVSTIKLTREVVPC